MTFEFWPPVLVFVLYCYRVLALLSLCDGTFFLEIAHRSVLNWEVGFADCDIDWPYVQTIPTTRLQQYDVASLLTRRCSLHTRRTLITYNLQSSALLSPTL